VSLPDPAAHPFVAVIVLAAVIASRKAQIRGAPGSASELTVISAAARSRAQRECESGSDRYQHRTQACG